MPVECSLTQDVIQEPCIKQVPVLNTDGGPTSKPAGERRSGTSSGFRRLSTSATWRWLLDPDKQLPAKLSVLCLQLVDLLLHDLLVQDRLIECFVQVLEICFSRANISFFAIPELLLRNPVLLLATRPAYLCLRLWFWDELLVRIDLIELALIAHRTWRHRTWRGWHAILALVRRILVSGVRVAWIKVGWWDVRRDRLRRRELRR